MNAPFEEKEPSGSPPKMNREIQITDSYNKPNTFSTLIIIFVLFVAKNMNNTLCCGYLEDAGCLALLNATFGGPAEGRIQQGEVSDSDINVRFQNLSFLVPAYTG
jgi:hypothetical protein